MTARLWTVLVAALIAGCASPQSCPAMALASGVHVDASAWVGDAQLAPAAGLKATVFIAKECVTAAPISRANPDDLFAAIGLGSGQVTVRVKLTAADGRALDVTTTSDVTVNKPFGRAVAAARRST